MVFVLVKPLVAIISQQLVLAKSGVHKAIHKRRGQVHAGRIHLRATAPKPCTGGRGKEKRFRVGQERNTAWWLVSGSELATWDPLSMPPTVTWRKGM